MRPVKLLRGALIWQAIVWGISGAALALFPRTILHVMFAQGHVVEYAWTRIAGIEAVGLAMLMVLVARRIEDLWWFSWTFVLTSGAVALLCTLNALFGLPPGSSAGVWWLIAGVDGAFTALLVVGLARTGIRSSPG
jgi:hypothetical protein